MWETIKKVLQKQGGTCIIVEDGKPVYVISSFDEFEKLLESQEPALFKGNYDFSEQELQEKINQEIANWKASQSERETIDGFENERENEVRIEDLPIQ